MIWIRAAQQAAQAVHRQQTHYTHCEDELLFKITRKLRIHEKRLLVKRLYPHHTHFHSEDWLTRHIPIQTQAIVIKRLCLFSLLSFFLALKMPDRRAKLEALAKKRRNEEEKEESARAKKPKVSSKP